MYNVINGLIFLIFGESGDEEEQEEEEEGYIVKRGVYVEEG